MKKWATQIFIMTVLGVFVLDAIPAYWKPHRYLQAALDPIVDITGLWQGRWTLFAPVDKENTYLTARLYFDDGSVHFWRSPEWRAMSGWEKHVMFRQGEYFDSIRLNANQAAWPALADYLARTHGQQSNEGTLPTRVELTRHWCTVKAPPDDLGLFTRIRLPIESYESYMFHTWAPEP